ncbi:FRG domain-containing protein [Herbaspirillum huttiense]|uniref:FRG domain-containing protein n=1 Tax=Herbaspirillum huttiense TaxID=863372 RepID=UPI002176A8FB|nr:FRG domain-containing protein [Herbaspirillum huttiense]UWE15650.1 FRG domain-containing protein [Herbaspirillum huttiense]
MASSTYSLKACSEALLLAKSRSLSNSSRKKFKNLHPEQIARAAYFCEAASVIRDFGLSNAFEKAALSLEPPHPIIPSRLAGKIMKMSGIRGTSVDPTATKLSLLSLTMLNEYAPDSDAAAMAHHCRTQSLILDPLYGFGYVVRDDNRFHNHCFALDFWQSRAKSMPSQVRDVLWSNRADSVLSGGVLFARGIFSGTIPIETNALKRVSAPEIIIKSEQHLQEVVSRLKDDLAKIPKVQLWFRGQAKDYQVPSRDALVKLGLTPYSNTQESDFTPSLYRKYDSHLETIEDFEKLLLDVAQWVEAARSILPETPNLREAFSSENPYARSSDGFTSFQRGLLLQQYGAPSAYLDITSDPLTAAWFAINRCTQMPDGEMRYAEHKWTDDEPGRWPTIFVFPLVKGAHPFLELSSILPTQVSMRAERQSCGLLGGAGNLARNYCARYLGLKLRLAPGFFLKRPDQRHYLFPSASEDRALAALNEAGFNSQTRLNPVTYVKHL